MAGPDGEADPGLIRQLPAEAGRIPFMQLVYLLRRIDPDAVAPGGVGPSAGENLRFRASASMAFAPTDVESVEEWTEQPDPWEPPRTRVRVTVNFLGLYGPASPMPNHVTEDILQNGADGEQVRDFLDLFHHRLISFVYRAWERVRPHLLFNPDGSDAFTRRGLSFVGLGTTGAAEKLPMAPVPLLRAAGLFSDQRRSAAGLTGLLRDRLAGVGVEVESCVETRVALPQDAQALLGRSGRLGEDARLGETVADLTGTFRVSLGPLTPERFRGLLPDREELARLVALIRFYAPDALGFSLRLLLRGNEAPPLRLSPEADLPLGRMSWLLSPGAGEVDLDLSTRGLDPMPEPA
jgi:type VI secretion system protein ImpH